MIAGGSSINTGNARATISLYSNLDVLHTATVAPGANQSHAFQGYSNDIVAGVIS